MEDKNKKEQVDTNLSPANTEFTLAQGADPLITSTEAQANTIIENAQKKLDEQALTTGSAHSLVVSSSATVTDMQDMAKHDPSLVKIQPVYDKDYKGPKFMDEKKVYYVSKETAGQLIYEGKAKQVK